MAACVKLIKHEGFGNSKRSKTSKFHLLKKSSENIEFYLIVLCIEVDVGLSKEIILKS